MKKVKIQKSLKNLKAFQMDQDKTIKVVGKGGIDGVTFVRSEQKDLP